MLAAAALAAYPASQNLDLQWAALVFAIAGVLVFALGLAARSPGALGSRTGLARRGLRGPVRRRGQRARPVHARLRGGLHARRGARLLVDRVPIPAWSEAAVAEWRLARIAGACIGAAVLAALALVAAAAATGTGGLALESLGVVAALGSVVLITVLVSRWAVDE